MERFLALDMGAESGRGVVGTVDPIHSTVTLEEVHRFPTGAIRMGDSLHWDLPRIVAEIGTIIGKAGEEGTLSGIGTDTWGVDYGLLDKNGNLVGLPYHYRDKRCDGMVEKVFSVVPKETVFAQTGLQTMQINTLFQLAAAAERTPRLLDAADKFLFIPDLLHYYLTGVAQAEYTIASTSQMYDSTVDGWATGILEKLNFPTRLLPPVVKDGTEYGTLLPHFSAASSVGSNVRVFAPGGHDTACAVAAVPAEEGDGWAYLSSGTWSLLGVEVPRPILTPEVLDANITNEGGVDGTIRLLKNIGGLWLVQESRRAYARLGSERTYDQLTRLAGEAKPLAALVDADHPSLLAPDDMPKAIRERCIATGQAPPEGIGATIRCCLDSLALKYRWTLEKMESVTGRSIHTLHIVGGGSQNRLLNQIAADATGRRVLAGPVEATALGNVLLQAKAKGLIGSLAEVRRFVRNSVHPEIYEPDPASQQLYNDAYGRFIELLAK